MAKKRSRNDEPRFTLLTNHGAVLVYLHMRPGDTIRTIAAALNLSERTAISVLANLREAGYLSVTRNGRRNQYVINEDAPAPRVGFSGFTVGSLIRALASQPQGQADP